MSNVLIIDNFDSFTYNLVQLVQQTTGILPRVVRNNELSSDLYLHYDSFLISPGPGIPEEAGTLLTFLSNLPNNKKVLGVCLGHQAIAIAFGGALKQLHEVYHGVSKKVNITKEDPIFRGLPPHFLAGHYHSWHVMPKLPICLEAIAHDDSSLIMALKHKTRPIVGIQFHPESIMTPDGAAIIQNFLAL